MVFLWACFSGGVFVVMFCGGVFVGWCSTGGVVAFLW